MMCKPKTARTLSKSRYSLYRDMRATVPEDTMGRNRVHMPYVVRYILFANTIVSAG